MIMIFKVTNMFSFFEPRMYFI